MTNSSRRVSHRPRLVTLAKKGSRKQSQSPQSKKAKKSSSIRQAPDPSKSFVPKGPTLRKEYEEKGIIEPSLSPDAGVLPEIVANRMLRRILGFAGFPLIFLFSFFAAYFILKYKYDITVLPAVVAYSTLGTITLSGIGITYGIFSSSWDEDIEGTWLGWEEASTNLLRAKDGLFGAREREKQEDEFDRLDRLQEQQKKKEESDVDGEPED